MGDLDIEKYIENTEFDEKVFDFLSGYLKTRMIEPSQIKHNDLMFYFDEYLDFKPIIKPINKPISFYKFYKNKREHLMSYIRHILL